MMTFPFDNYRNMNSLDNTPYGFTLEGTPEHERFCVATKKSMQNAIAFNEKQRADARAKHELNKQFPEPPKHWDYEQ